jgi:hypothetical protein
MFASLKVSFDHILTWNGRIRYICMCLFCSNFILFTSKVHNGNSFFFRMNLQCYVLYAVNEYVNSFVFELYVYCYP